MNILFSWHDKSYEDHKDFFNQFHGVLERQGVRTIFWLWKNTQNAPFPSVNLPQNLFRYDSLRIPKAYKQVESFQLEPTEVDRYIEREALWAETSFTAKQSTQLQEAAEACFKLLNLLFNSNQLSLCVIYNPNRVSSMILEKIALAHKVPIRYIERGFLPGYYHWDPRGMLVDSELSLSTSLEELDTRPISTETVATLDQLSSKVDSWWQQGQAQGENALRKALNIPVNATILFFPGQVDADTQNFLYSPYFNSTLEAWSWLVNRVAQEKDVYLLGKHHPMSSATKDAFEQVATKQPNTAWLSDLSISDCLALCDVVISVNSTVISEALLRKIPVVQLGQSVFTGKGIVWEWNGDNQHFHHLLTSARDKISLASQIRRYQSFADKALSEYYFRGDETPSVSSRLVKFIEDSIDDRKNALAMDTVKVEEARWSINLWSKQSSYVKILRAIAKPVIKCIKQFF